MRLQEDTVIALFGPSGTGKSTVADLLARDLDVPLRMCGDAVRATAASKGLSFSDLSDADHRAIDEETCHWLTQSRTACIVEGRFLDVVLSRYPNPQSIFLVRLDATAEVRVTRIGRRSGKEIGLEKLAAIDKDDAQFRERVYKGWQPLAARLTLDNSGYGPEECTSIIKAQLSPLTARV